MKALKMLALALVTIAVTTSSSAQGMAVDGARAMFNKALTEFNSANYEAYLSNVADDFEGYTGIYTPFRFVGKTAWSNFIMGLKNYRSATYDQRQPSYRAYGDNTVLCNAYFVFTTIASDGTVDTQSGRETTVLVKINGTWKIANYHFSPIF